MRDGEAVVAMAPFHRMSEDTWEITALDPGNGQYIV